MPVFSIDVESVTGRYTSHRRITNRETPRNAQASRARIATMRRVLERSRHIAWKRDNPQQVSRIVRYAPNRDYRAERAAEVHKLCAWAFDRTYISHVTMSGCHDDAQVHVLVMMIDVLDVLDVLEATQQPIPRIPFIYQTPTPILNEPDYVQTRDRQYADGPHGPTIRELLELSFSSSISEADGDSDYSDSDHDEWWLYMEHVVEEL